MPCEQLGIIQQIGVSTYQTVVIVAAAEQQQVLQPMAVFALAAVIEHLAQATIGHRIMRAAGKLVVHLLVVKHQHAESVMLLMQVRHTLRLLQISAGSEDNHVGGCLSMDILVGHLALKFRAGIAIGRLDKGDKLAASALGGAERGDAVGHFHVHLHRGKRPGHIPHACGGVAARQLVGGVAAGVVQAKCQAAVLQRQLAFIVDSDEIQSRLMHGSPAGKVHLKIKFIGAIKGKLLDGLGQLIVIVGKIGGDSHDIGTHLRAFSIVIGIGHRTRCACRLRGKHGIDLDRRAVHETIQVKLEGLAAVRDKTLAQEGAAGLAGIDILLLVVDALDIGVLQRTGGSVLRFGDVDIVKTGVVGDQVATRLGIGVLHLQLLQVVVQVSPRGGTLSVEQDVLASPHNRHLRQVVNIVVTEHRLAQRRTAVAEDVNL